MLGCAGSKETDPKAETGEELSGGTFTSQVDGENAFAAAGPGLSERQQNEFELGNSLFRSNWVAAPASATARDGLGPVMNALSCGACHPKDGRSMPPQSADENPVGLLFRLSQHAMAGYEGDGVPSANYGMQLNNRAIAGVQPEGTVQVTYTERVGAFADGSTFSLRTPAYNFSLNYGEFEAGIDISPRIGQQVFGLGLLEAISEQDILANEDPQDADKNGISGRANRVRSRPNEPLQLGRFGWKANVSNIIEQIAAAAQGDLSLTSNLQPNENLTGIVWDRYSALPNGGNPELPDQSLGALATYLQGIAPPARRSVAEADVLKGKALFTKLNCSGCHAPKFTTGQHPMAPLVGQTIRPYTDLLLHDMGEGLADGRPDGKATGNEWRTAPLWGLGRIKDVNRHTFLLHDGRARNAEEAILWHGGEAEKATNDYRNLAKVERQQLLSFLNSL